MPFPERDGEYWGFPQNDAAAIAELEKHRTAGISFVVVLWTAYWWLDHLPEFAHRLQSSADRLMENDRVIVFRLHG